jgi:8-oxo-dGTP pyrophosphatase MutT (NUDIX family)
VGSLSEVLREALLPPRPDPPLPDGTPAAVLVPVFERDRASLLFTVRSQEVRDHKGEISFPGGVRHEDDPDLLETALRETEEELGLSSQGVEVLGALPPVHTVVTGYVIVPFVGIVHDTRELQPSPVEIAEVLELGIDELSEAEEEVRVDGRQGWFAYTVGDHTVWGATGRIVHSFLGALGPRQRVAGERGGS